MEYTRSTTVAAPLEQVAALYVDTASWPEWQPELLSVEVLEGAPPDTGGRSRLTYRRGRGTIVMTETVSLSELPGTWNAVYEAPGIHNICDTRFVAVDAHTTRIEQRNVFRLTGMMRLVGVLFRSSFPHETEKSLRIYKGFVEKRLGATA
ncbi:MAG: hypothetical protein RLZZ608_838 [Actinomycetota bacterium]|jgi:uncharacterized membrane protein